jgi:hypothetical protein
MTVNLQGANRGSRFWSKENPKTERKLKSENQNYRGGGARTYRRVDEAESLDDTRRDKTTQSTCSKKSEQNARDS